MLVFSVEFQFVQDYLFRIPKLRAMVGANRSLAQTLEVLENSSLSCLLENDQKWTAEMKAIREFEVAAYKRLFGERCALPGDDPAANYKKGIVSAGGGHFEFVTDETPENVEGVIRKTVAEHAPGLAYTLACIRPADLNFLDVSKALSEVHSATRFQVRCVSAAPLGFPYMQACQFSSGEPASEEKTYDGEPSQYLGKRTSALLYAGEEAVPPLRDMAGYVEMCVLVHANARLNTSARLPREFSEFFEGDAARRYLAVIAVDGNDIGSGYQKFRKEHCAGVSYTEGAAATEAYFYHVRALNRLALVQALVALDLPVLQHKDAQVLPLRILMLGGDDLLLLLRPTDALGFAEAYAMAWDSLLANPLEEQQLKWAVCFGRKTFKMGMASVPHNYPFHAAYDLSQALAKNAKRAGTEHSTIDWHVLFSGSEEPLQRIRNREYLRRDDGTTELRRLTRRPYPILGEAGPATYVQQLDWARSLIRLTTNKDEQRVPRSKLRLLQSLAAMGREEAELLLAELKAEIQGAPLPESAYSKEEGAYITDLLDIVELYEVLHSGRSARAKMETA